MTLDRFCIKFLATPDSKVDQTTFIPVLHEWIRDRSLKGTLLDVADYRHVPQGPGIMLVTYEVNYAMDEGNGELGLFAQVKHPEGETLAEQVVNLVRQTATFGNLLQSDARVSGLKLDGHKFYWMSNNRLHAPNTAEGFAAVKPALETAAATLYPGQSIAITQVENDPRDRLTAIIEVQDAVEISALAA